MLPTLYACSGSTLGLSLFLFSCVGDSGLASIDPSKATSLRCSISSRIIERHVGSHHTPNHHIQALKYPAYLDPCPSRLHYPGADIRLVVGEAIFRQWSDLDRLLVQIWESRSIRPKVILAANIWEGKEDAGTCVGYLLPEVTKRGIIDLVQPM